MTTFGTMKARIADEAAATGLDDQIAREIQSAIAHYQTRRFHFNQGELEFVTVNNKTAYGSADNVDIPNIADIQAAKVSGQGWSERIVPATYMAVFNTIDDVTGGVPEFYAYRDFKIHVAPTPSSGYTVTVAYLKRLATLSDDADTNDWMTIGEELIRQRAKRSLYGNVLHNYEAAGWARGEEMDALAILTKLEMKLSHSAPARFHDLAVRGPYNIYGDT